MSSGNRPQPSGPNLEKQRASEQAGMETKARAAGASKAGSKEDPAQKLDINQRNDFNRKRLTYLTAKKSGNRELEAKTRKDYEDYADRVLGSVPEEDEEEEDKRPKLPMGWNEDEMEILTKQEAQKQGIKENDIEEKSKEIEEANQIPGLEEAEAEEDRDNKKK